MFEKIAKYWLFTVLILLPFQGSIAGFFSSLNNWLGAFFGYIDEITVVLFIPLAIMRFYRERKLPDRLFMILLYPLLIFSIFGLISGINNGNSLFITSLGIFDYIKNFIVLFIYASFIRDSKDFRRILNILLIVGVVLGVVAILQEITALSARYIFNTLTEINPMYWRLGIFRTSSFMYDPNVFGLYCVLILSVYMNITDKVRSFYLIPLVSGIIMSVSRIVYTGFILLGLSQLRRRRWFIGILVILIIMLIAVSSIEDINVLKYLNIETQLLLYGNEDLVIFMNIARNTAFEIWKDYFLFGSGPGSYGGTVSLKYNSPLYERYHLPDNFMYHLRMYGNIDQFWPQVLAECGIIGALSFAALLIALIVVFLILRIWSSSEDINRLFTGLAVYTLIIFIYSLYTGLNLTPILFTYSAIAGMAIGSESQHYYK